MRRSLQFDALGRVVKSRQTTGTAEFNFEYSFNALGGLETEKYPTGWTVSSCYDTAGRVSAVKNGGVSSTDVYAQVAFNGSWRNRYDVENRIVRVELPGNPVTVAGSYEYDGEGRRVKKTAGTEEVTYVFDAMGQLMQEVQLGGTAAAAGRSYLFQDHLGSTRLRVDANGMRQGWWDYAPFGEVVPGALGSRSGVAGGAYEGPRTRMMFTGKEKDGESGLDYFGARYLATTVGRFSGPDAPIIDQNPMGPQSWNLYSYGRNNPLRFIDPTGQKCVNTSNGPADDGTGGGCPAAGVDPSGTIAPQTVNAIDMHIRETGYGQEVRVNGQLVYESGLRRDYASELMFLGMIRALGGGRSSTAAATGVAADSIWNVLPPTARGGVIEQMLGANLPRTFPVIDRFLKGTITSIKSIDLRAASHLDPVKLERTLMGHVDKLHWFAGAELAGYAVPGSGVARVLEVAIPNGTATAAQQAVFQKVAASAAQIGVQVVIIPIK